MTLPPIPAHLPAWQAGHLAWLASQGKPTRYSVPEGVEPCRADLTGADLRWADLTGADLSGADLSDANLSEANLSGADLHGADMTDSLLTGADMTGADMTGAVLTDAYLIGADLTDAVLTGADLTYAVLSGADLTGCDLTGAVMRGTVLKGVVLRWAAGIAMIGPVGRNGRTIYAVAHNDGPMVHAGLWWGSVDDTIARIEADYADDLAARDRYIAAVRAVAAMVTP